jgi:energy-coupling factor transporter ATP-binding protein EcfA2
VKIRRVGLRGIGPFKEQIFDFGQGTNPDLADVVLLTGPNGSGKTSMLCALAAVLGGSSDLDGRWATNGAVTLEVEIAGARQFVHCQRDSEFSSVLPGFVPGPSILIGLIGASEHHFRFSADAQKYFGSAKSRSGKTALVAGPLFAYNAFRLIPPTATAFQLSEPSDDPIVGAGDFSKSIEAGVFDQWIVSTQTKLALASQDGDFAAVSKYALSVSTVEEAISKVIGKEFKLQVNREPLEVVGMIDGLRTPLRYLPDGLRSLLAWIGDVLRRLDRLEKPADVDGRLLPIIILLDEIEVHLHPSWQRAVLPVAQRLFPNAQIIVSTHSPFVVQSADDAVVIRLGPGGELLETQGPQIGRSYRVVLEEILGYSGTYDTETDKELHDFELLVHRVLSGHGSFEFAQNEAQRLAESRPALNSILGFHLAQLRERTGVAN